MVEWHAQRDPASGKTYYYNEKTGLTMWEAPPGYKSKKVSRRSPTGTEKRALKSGLSPGEAQRQHRRLGRVVGVQKSIQDAQQKSESLKDEVHTLQMLLERAKGGKEISRSQMDFVQKYSPQKPAPGAGAGAGGSEPPRGLPKAVSPPPGMMAPPAAPPAAAPAAASKPGVEPAQMVQQMYRVTQVYQHLSSRPKDRGWYYMDSEDKLFGPHPSSHMRFWLKNGEFGVDQLVRCGTTGPFVPIKSLYPMLTDHVFDVSLSDLKDAQASLENRV